jgi:hypothetical protein
MDFLFARSAQDRERERYIVRVICLFYTCMK